MAVPLHSTAFRHAQFRFIPGRALRTSPVRLIPPLCYGTAKPVLQSLTEKNFYKVCRFAPSKSIKASSPEENSLCPLGL